MTGNEPQMVGYLADIPAYVWALSHFLTFSAMGLTAFLIGRRGYTGTLERRVKRASRSRQVAKAIRRNQRKAATRSQSYVQW